MSLGGVDWRMAQPMQAQSAAPDWRQIMQTAVMGGAGMPMGGSANAPFDPSTLPGMAQQAQQQRAGKPKPSAAPQVPAAPAPLTPTPASTRITPAPTDPVQQSELMKPAYQEIKPGILYRGPDGGMFDIYGNVWAPSGYLLAQGE